MKKNIISPIIFCALISIDVSQSRATEIVVVREYAIPPAADFVRAFYDWAIHRYADSFNAQVKAKKKKAGGDGGGGGGGNDEEVTLDCQGHKSDWGIQITCTPPNTAQPVVSCIARNPANFSPLELPRVNNGYGDMVRELLVSVVDIPTGRGANPGASIAAAGIVGNMLRDVGVTNLRVREARVGTPSPDYQLDETPFLTIETGATGRLGKKRYFANISPYLGTERYRITGATITLDRQDPLTIATWDALQFGRPDSPEVRAAVKDLQSIVEPAVMQLFAKPDTIGQVPGPELTPQFCDSLNLAEAFQGGGNGGHL